MSRAEFIRWLLELIQQAPTPPLTARLLPEDTEFEEAIEVVIGGKTFLIAVDEREVD